MVSVQIDRTECLAKICEGDEKTQCSVPSCPPLLCAVNTRSCRASLRALQGIFCLRLS